MWSRAFRTVSLEIERGWDGEGASLSSKRKMSIDFDFRNVIGL